MDSFVRSLLSATPIARDDEVALARRARAGDAEARHELIASGLRSVALRACSMGFSGDDLSDAVQAGAVGLIRAVDRFDPERGVRLSTYAWRWIGAEMVACRMPGDLPLDDLDVPAPEVPDHACDLLDGLSDQASQVLRLRYGVGDRAGRHHGREDVARRLGLTVSQVRTIEGKAVRQLGEGLARVHDRASE